MAATILGTSVNLGLTMHTWPLGVIILTLLCILFVDSVLMLSNLLAMNYLFTKTLNEYRSQGLPYASLLGVEALYDASNKETKFSLLLTLLSTAALTMYLVGGNSPEVVFIYLSMGAALVTFGFSILRREHVLDPDEMLKLYDPDTFPQVLTTDLLLETFIDPFNRLKFRNYLDDLSHLIREDLKVGDAVSKITLLLLQNLYGVLNLDDVRDESSELLRNRGDVFKVEAHKIFGFSRLKVIVEKARRLVPELMRLIDRLFVGILDDLSEFKGSDYYIDAEVTPERTKGEIGRCFIFLYNNNSSKTLTLNVGYSSGSTGPATSEVTLNLPVRDFELPYSDALPPYSKGESGSDGRPISDTVGLMSRVMENARVVWFSYEMKENGVKPIVVTVRDKETGQTLYGRTFLVEASNNLPELGIKILGVASVFIGVVLPILRLFKVPI
jgi:hypothetical protein